VPFKKRLGFEWEIDSPEHNENALRGGGSALEMSAVWLKFEK
jgi:hypothetical protein